MRDARAPRALEIAEKTFEPGHPSIAIRQSNLALVLQDLGQMEEARDLLRQALASDEKTFEPGHPSIAISQSNLALVLQDLGQMEEARDLLRQALASDEKTFEPGHPSIATSQSNLALVLQDLGQMEEARDLLRKALASAEKTFEPGHPSIAISQSNLALVLKDLGQMEEARDLLRQALASDEKTFEPGHPSIAISQSNLALVLKDLGQMEEARDLLRKAYRAYLDRFGPDHPGTRTIKGNLDSLGESSRSSRVRRYDLEGQHTDLCPWIEHKEDTRLKPKNTICLWFDKDAEEAARFYAATFPDSQVTAVHEAPGDYPSGKKGDVPTVDFTVLGIPCLGLNGGPAFRHSEAFFVRGRDGGSGRDGPLLERDRRQWRHGKRRAVGARIGGDSPGRSRRARSPMRLRLVAVRQSGRSGDDDDEEDRRGCYRGGSARASNPRIDRRKRLSYQALTGREACPTAPADLMNPQGATRIFLSVLWLNVSTSVLLTAVCLPLGAQSSPDLNAEVAELRALVDRLQARVAELETRFKASAVPASRRSRYPCRHHLRPRRRRSPPRWRAPPSIS